MSSASKYIVLVIVVVGIAFTVSADRTRHFATVHLEASAVLPAETPVADSRTLRVCADPNNLPFSNSQGEGFENAIATVIAADLGRTLRYYWYPQRRGFLRNTLLAGACDVVVGVLASLDMARVTRPYYRSSYVFVSRRDRRLSISSLDDTKLRSLRIGIPITGDDYDNPPPAKALAARHIIDNVRGYPVYGDYSKPHPSWGAVEAVRRGEIDIAIAWGPIAGFAAQQQRPALTLAVVPDHDPSLQFTFDVAMAVRPHDTALAASLDGVIERRAAQIEKILDAYGVPRAHTKARVRQ